MNGMRAAGRLAVALTTEYAPDTNLTQTCVLFIRWSVERSGRESLYRRETARAYRERSIVGIDGTVAGERRWTQRLSSSARSSARRACARRLRAGVWRGVEVRTRAPRDETAIKTANPTIPAQTHLMHDGGRGRETERRRGLYQSSDRADRERRAPAGSPLKLCRLHFKNCL